jgi:chromosome segregation ATPase
VVNRAVVGDSRIAPVLNEDLESRFARLEHEVGRLREDVASARALAALADRDVAEFRTEMRSYRQVLNALRETQLEQGQQISELRVEMRQEINGLGREVDSLREEMRAGFALQATSMAQITALLAKIIDSDHGERG